MTDERRNTDTAGIWKRGFRLCFLNTRVSRAFACPDRSSGKWEEHRLHCENAWTFHWMGYEQRFISHPVITSEPGTSTGNHWPAEGSDRDSAYAKENGLKPHGVHCNCWLAGWTEPVAIRTTGLTFDRGNSQPVRVQDDRWLDQPIPVQNGWLCSSNGSLPSGFRETAGGRGDQR